MVRRSKPSGTARNTVLDDEAVTITVEWENFGSGGRLEVEGQGPMPPWCGTVPLQCGTVPLECGTGGLLCHYSAVRGFSPGELPKVPECFRNASAVFVFRVSSLSTRYYFDA